MMKNERPIPPAALRDDAAVEMLRVWIAEKKLHCSMKVGMYEEGMGIREEKAWGKILADVARHVANAVRDAYGRDVNESVERIRNAFTQELDSPTTKVEGRFVDTH